MTITSKGTLYMFTPGSVTLTYFLKSQDSLKEITTAVFYLFIESESTAYVVYGDDNDCSNIIHQPAPLPTPVRLHRLTQAAAEEVPGTGSEVVVGGGVEEGVGGGVDQVGVVQHGVHRHRAHDHQERRHVGRQECHRHQEEHGRRLDVGAVGRLVAWLGQPGRPLGVGGRGGAAGSRRFG